MSGATNVIIIIKKQNILTYFITNYGFTVNFRMFKRNFYFFIAYKVNNIYYCMNNFTHT